MISTRRGCPLSYKCLAPQNAVSAASCGPPMSTVLVVAAVLIENSMVRQRSGC